MSFRLSRPGTAALEQLCRDVRDADVTYDPVGATRVRLRRPGFTTRREQRRLGEGPEVWGAAVAGLRHWEAHRRAGMVLHPDPPVLEVGATVVVAARLLGVHVAAPCRIVYVTDEAERFGFAYGTLPGHPEAGEESFHVEQRSDGVSFVIGAFFRMVHPLARLAGPVSHRVEREFRRRYLDGLAMHVAESCRG